MTAAPEGIEWGVLTPVRNLIDQHPDIALAIRDVVAEYVRDATYPALRVVEITDDGETYAGVRCPWCGADVENGERLAVLDSADRATTIAPDEFDHDRRQVAPWYDGHGDYESVCYIDEGCGRPVSLPEGWAEV